MLEYWTSDPRPFAEHSGQCTHHCRCRSALRRRRTCATSPNGPTAPSVRPGPFALPQGLLAPSDPGSVAAQRHISQALSSSIARRLLTQLDAALHLKPCILQDGGPAPLFIGITLLAAGCMDLHCVPTGPRSCRVTYSFYSTNGNKFTKCEAASASMYFLPGETSWGASDLARGLMSRRWSQPCAHS